MKTTKTVCLLALVILIAAVAQPAEESTKSAATPEEPKISNTRFASCLVKATSDPAVMPLNEFIIEDLLRSSGVVGKAAKDVLGISPDDAILCEELFIIEDLTHYSSGGSGIPPTPYPTTIREPGSITPGATTSPTTYLGTSDLTPTHPAPTPTRQPTTTRYPTRTPTKKTTRRPRTPTSSGTTVKPVPTAPRPTTTTRRPRAPATTIPDTAEQTILLRLQVDLSDTVEEIINQPVKHAAEEFMLALIENLRSALSNAFDQYCDKVKNQLNLANEEAVRAETKLREMQQSLASISGTHDLSRSVILRDISTIRQQIQTAEMEQVTNEALFQATTRRINERENEIIRLIAKDDITKELKAMLDVHEQRLKNTQKLVEAGRASADELDVIKEKIIKARIDLAQRQEEVSNPPGSLVLGSLNDELANLITKRTLSQQQIFSLQKQFDEADKLLAKADSYELLSLKAEIAKQNLEETLLWRERLGRKMRSIQPPDVTVIGAE